MATFNIQAKTVIESATLELNAKQLEDLAEAAEYVRELREHVLVAEDEEVLPGYYELGEVQVLLDGIESLVGQTGTIKPKRRMTRKKRNPTSGGS